VFWLSLRALDTRRAVWFAAAGAACGVLSLVRPDYLPFPLFFLVAAWLFLRRPLTALRGFAFLSAAMFLVLLPWMLRNQRDLGKFTPGSTSAWAGLYQTIGQFPNPYGIVFDDTYMMDRARSQGFDSFDDAGADRYFKQQFLEIARENPGLLVGQVLRRIPLAIAPLYRWGYVNRFYESGHSTYDYLAREGLGVTQVLRRHPIEFIRAYWDRLISGAIAFGLSVGCVAMLVVERRRWRTVVLLLLPYVTIMLPHLGYNMGARHLAPALFCQLVVAAYWIARLSRRGPVELWQPAASNTRGVESTASPPGRV
jgi:hypothetical protein